MSIQTTPPEPDQAETYRPLSLFALGGLTLSLVAAAAVLVGGLVPVATGSFGLFCASMVLTPLVVAAVVAVRGGRGLGLVLAAAAGFAGWAVVLGLGGLLLLSRKEPWVLPAWFWALTVGGAVLSWVARNQIKGSEGTLSGEGLARLGLIVSAGVAVVYGAYVSSSMLAVQAQARACALGFLDDVKKGDPYQAFTWALQHHEPREREHIDVNYNTPTGPNEGSPFNTLTEGPLFKLVQMGGEQTTFEERGLTTDYTQGKYIVVIQYRGRNSFYTFDFQVVTEGVYADTASGQRRVWNVAPGGTRLAELPPPVPTERGKVLLDHMDQGGQLLDQFLQAVTEDRLLDAFLLTLPPADREKAGPKALESPEGKRFTAGKLLDTRDVSAPAAVRGPGLAVIGKMFDPTATRLVNTAERLSVFGLSRSPQLPPAYAEVEGGWRLTFPIRLQVRDASWALPKYVGDLKVVIDGTEAGGVRVTGIKVVRVTPPPEVKKGPGG